MSTYSLGWRNDLEPRAKAEFGHRFVAFASAVRDDRPLPKAYSGTQDILTWMDQGGVGSCAGNAGDQSIESSIAGANRLGRLNSEIRRLSRAFVYYFGRKLDGGLGEGCTITNIMRAADQYGACPDELWPYKPQRGYLNTAPTDAMKAAALLYQFDGVASLDFADRTQVKRSIYSANYPVIGIPWSWDWDNNPDSAGRITSIGWPVGGHALCLMGWIEGWDGHDWWQLVNSHGLIYPALPPSVAATVEGYRPAHPDRCYSFWVRDDLLARRLGGWGSEIIAPLNVQAVPYKGSLSWYDL